ncbi:unnamed protein product, partial [Closterium sp. NIES-54]
VWCLLCCATNGSIYFITAGLVSSQLNFPHSGGVVAGIVVGFIGLSGAIFAQVLLGGQGDGRCGLGGRFVGEGGRCGGSQGGKAGEVGVRGWLEGGTSCGGVGREKEGRREAPANVNFKPFIPCPFSFPPSQHATALSLYPPFPSPMQIYSALLAPNPPAFLLLACIGPAAVGILSLFIVRLFPPRIPPHTQGGSRGGCEFLPHAAPLAVALPPFNLIVSLSFIRLPFPFPPLPPPFFLPAPPAPRKPKVAAEESTGFALILHLHMLLAALSLTSAHSFLPLPFLQTLHFPRLTHASRTEPFIGSVLPDPPASRTPKVAAEETAGFSLILRLCMLLAAFLPHRHSFFLTPSPSPFPHFFPVPPAARTPKVAAEETAGFSLIMRLCMLLAAFLLLVITSQAFTTFSPHTTTAITITMLLLLLAPASVLLPSRSPSPSSATPSSSPSSLTHPHPQGSSDLSQPLLQSSSATSAAGGAPGSASPGASVLPPIREGETLHGSSVLPPSSPPPTHPPPPLSLSPHHSAFSPLSHSRTSPKPTSPEYTSPYNTPPLPSSGNTCSAAQSISSPPGAGGARGGGGLRGAGAISFVSPNRSGDAPKLGLSSSITAAAQASSFGTHSSVGSATLMHLLLGTSADSRTNRSGGATSGGGGEGEGGDDDWSYYFGEEETSVHGKNQSRVSGITSPKGGYSRGGDDEDEDECGEEEEEDGEEGEEEGDGAGDESTEQAHAGGAAAAGGRVYLGQDHSFGQALSTVEFWLLYGGLVCGFGAGLTAITNLAQIGEAQGYGNAQVLTSLVSIWQFLGRLASGSLSEHFVRAHGMPRPMALAAIQLLMAVGHLAFALAPPGGVYLGSLLIGFTYGGLCSVMPVIAAELFGRRCLGLLYNSLLAAAPLGSYLFSGVLAGYLYEIEARKDRGVTAGLVGAASLLAPREHWALEPVVGVGHVAGGSAAFSGVRKTLGLMLPTAAPTSPAAAAAVMGATAARAAATAAASAGAEHIGQGWLGSSWFGQGMQGWFSGVVGSAGGGGGEGPKACHGAHCFRLIFLILTAVCVLGAAVNVLVASRTARVYGLMRHSEGSAEETDEPEEKEDAR